MGAKTSSSSTMSASSMVPENVPGSLFIPARCAMPASVAQKSVPRQRGEHQDVQAATVVRSVARGRGRWCARIAYDRDHVRRTGAKVGAWVGRGVEERLSLCE